MSAPLFGVRRMSYRKSEDTPAKKRRRLPHKVIIERRQPFRAADEAEVEAECLRITNGAEFYHHMERFGDVYWHVVRFSSEHQAEAFRAAAQRCAFARRPAPLFGPPAEERAAFQRSCLAVGLPHGRHPPRAPDVAQCFWLVVAAMVRGSSGARCLSHAQGS
jgi:hypothetical protein